MKKLQYKLFLGFIVILLLMTGLGSLSYYNMRASNEDVKRMVSNDLELLVASDNFAQNITERVSVLRAYILYDSSTYRTQYLDLSSQSVKLKKELLDAGARSNEKRAIDDIVKLNDEWSKYVEETVLPTFIMEGRTDKTLELLEKAEPQSVQLTFKLKALAAENQKSMNASGQSILESAANVEKLIISLIACAVIIGMIIAFLTARVIVKPILRVANRLDRVANGDLSGKPLKTKAKDEIGRLVASSNKMVEGLRNLVLNVNQSSEQITASAQELTASSEQSSNATEQIAASSEQMASGAEAQLNSVNEAVVTINQISAGIQQIAANSESVSTIAEEASTSCKDGVGTVNEVVEQMHSIENTVKETAKVIETLGERSNEIGKIVTLITDISDQTSLLALNAAIEAARAGDAGRGFAVVADEVRKLAEQSADSALQITNLIRTIQEETSTAVHSMVEGTEKTVDGLAKTNELSDVFHKIEKSVQDVEARVQEVTTAAEQIAAGSNQMVSSVNVVKEAAEENARTSQDNAAASEEQLAMMEEIASSAQALTRLADEMADMVRTFKL
ncbi:hypothetical protein DCC39_16555 [Pueribacillus theae]|uniref:Methyl-accepting chemotaxis protein n=1 Tax=Pueribacillus theae TaxID=2171751 RepID=A0A2U1JR24_9BACI|nr:HAMP domain-containing methyl-accepting chemotaxis protein [Pueribacillus theae]PWA07601.1 hypothetical protein DCC39_16555 [Pueribacillus theae]